MSLDLNTRGTIVPWVCIDCKAMAIFLPPSWKELTRQRSPRACICKKCDAACRT